ncbi:chain length determinant family protein [Yersinia rohdei]|uniref:Chain length determinant family protein n=1 Tax=Yersinia rohdei TaxID=29485 RepID=A0A0U1HNY7_YERRO|nr:polysaccharide biosynthesis tyrosine autokinase [Yersinia rohdei]AJJ12220.1 chain length determinant family protein [Yersinia rohdei]MDN0094945.1 polysaccharide biosynthesis tyrosine autokinase [Yersinia rohdei]OWF82066.1 capsular biosynthesis protein [Yersinia rohdei]CNE59814.1 Tyrosine-protein kinase YwqD [Yersinia rohdei]CNI46155.1 Tyrosine-protein kinase YwqD [Yersinia rohdei]
MKLSIVENGKQRESVIDISRFANEIKKNIWKIILAGVIAGVVAYPLISMMSSKYVSTATVLIKAQPDNVSPFPQVEGYDSTRNGYYETQYALMQSHVVLERAVRALKLDQDPKFNGDKSEDGDNAQQRVDQALKTMLKNLTFNSVRNTHLATVSYESTSPQQAAEIANGVAQAFINYTIEQKRINTLKAREENQRRLAELQQQMNKQKTAIENYLTQQGLLTFRGVDGFETEQLGIVTNRLADAIQRRVAAESLYNEVRQGQGHTLGDIISLPSISNHAQIQDLRIALIQAKRSLYELQKLYGPKHAKILEAQGQVQAIQDQTSLALRELENGLRQQYQAALADEKNYQKQLDQQKEIFQKVASKRDGYNDLRLQLDKTEELYKVVYQRAQELALSGTYTDADAVLYDPAVPPARPSKPNKPLLMMMIVMLVVVFYVLYIIVKAAMDNSVNSLSQLQRRLSLEPLGEIRRFTGVGSRGKLRDLIINDPMNADIIHSIRTLIMLNKNPLQVIATTSTDHGEGRSLLANLLASSFSFDQKTLLIDMDFFNSEGLSGELGSPKAKGVAEVLRGETAAEEVVIRLNDKLDFLPRGNITVSSLLMLSSDKLQPLIETLRTRYQRIIIDAAAVSQSQDVQLISPFIDGFIFVLKAGAVPADKAANAIEKVATDRSIVIGGVLNQVLDKNLETKEGLHSLNYHTNELMNTTGRI